MKAFGTDAAPWLVIGMPEYDSTVTRLCKSHLAERSTVVWGRFPDGTPNIELDAASIEGRDVLFIGSPEPSRYLEFFSVVYSVPRYFARSFLVILPFFPTGTMERVEREGEVATAKTLSRMMSASPAPQVGQTCFMVFDIHALATRFFFSDHVKIVLPSAMPDAFSAIRSLAADVVVCFPDDGAKKRFGKVFSNAKFDVVSCGKVRGEGNKRTISLQEGHVVGRSVVIVDDMSQSGGTLSACRDVLYQEGASSVSALVTHGVFPNMAWKKFVVDKKGVEVSTKRRGFHVFFVTDSVPWVSSQMSGIAPFQILHLSDSIARVLSLGHAGSHL